MIYGSPEEMSVFCSLMMGLPLTSRECYNVSQFQSAPWGLSRTVLGWPGARGNAMQAEDGLAKCFGRGLQPRVRVKRDTGSLAA